MPRLLPAPLLGRTSTAIALVCLLRADLAAAQPSGEAEPPAPAPAPEPSQAGEDVPAGSATPDLEANTAVIARAGLEVDTANAGPTGPVMLERIEELGNLELRRAEILPRRAAEDPVLRIRVEVRGEQGDTYAILTDVAVNGEALPGSAREIVCSLCTESEAVERARSELLRLVPFVRARFRPASKPSEPPPVVAPPPPDNRLGTLGKAGVGLLVGGAVALGAGIGLAVASPPVDPANPLRQLNLRPAGYAVLGVGAAAVVSGAVLLIIDRRKIRRVAQVAPMLGPGTAGLLLVGRF